MPDRSEMYSAQPKHATFVTMGEITLNLPEFCRFCSFDRSFDRFLFARPEGIDEIGEGKARPGFFRGVATVVTKLLNIVQPQRAFFGQKDGLQSIVVRRIVRELNIPTQIVVCPTARERDGLAMSSRNVYLSPEDRGAAPILFASLTAARDAHSAGERDVATLRRAVLSVLAREPRVKPQYVSLADTDTGAELADGAKLAHSDAALLSIAVGVGDKGLRLIDNVILGEIKPTQH